MDNIKKYFIRSMVDNINQSIEEKDRLRNNNINCNEYQTDRVSSIHTGKK